MQAARLGRSLLRVCHNFFVVGATSSSPTQVGEEDIASRSRGAIFVRARVFASHHVANGFPACAISWVSLCPTQAANKGEAERRETRRHNPRLAGTGRPLRGRSPLGVPLRLLPGGQLVPKALHQAMLRETVRSVRSVWTAQPGRGSCASPRALPAPENPTKQLSPYSEHLTRRSCCRQADARCRPGAGYKSARGHRARPVPRSVLAKNVPSKGEMESFSSAGDMNSRYSGGASHPVDLTKNHFTLFV